ncbi:MAG: molybdopterin-dependent oxidoreductase, partial [Candidatus Caldarchaeum sp.]|nr:molybdopterin-dependent oxidoreductase [Candidatus Caldarchaeum sp.]
MLAVKTILEEKPYPIKAAVISHQNIVSHIPNDDSVVKALEKLEFVAVIDSMWSETCKYADVILPAKFFFETTSATINVVSKSPVGQISVWKKAIDPPEGVDAKSVAEIVFELTKRLMPEKAEGGKRLLTPEEIWKEQAKALEIDLEKLLENGTMALYDSPDYSPLTAAGVLPTDTGEIELLNLKALKQFSEYRDKPDNLNPFPTWVEPRYSENRQLGDDEFIPVDYMHNLTAINT